MEIKNKLINCNYTVGRTDSVKAIMLHIAEGTMEGMHSWFNNPSAQVSAHYGISKNGEVWQFVKEGDTAWHSGGLQKPSELYTKYHRSYNPNSFTIGIEHEGKTGERFTPQMIKSLRNLVELIVDKYKLGELILGKNIMQHADVNSVNRANCVGTGINITNDIIIPINNKKMKLISQELVQRLKIDRPDLSSAGIITHEDISNWWWTNGRDQFIFRVAELGRVDVRNVISDSSSGVTWENWYTGSGYMEYTPNIWNFKK